MAAADDARPRLIIEFGVRWDFGARRTHGRGIGFSYSRFPLAHSAKLLAGLTLPNDVRRGIEGDNAVKLFPRLA